MPPGGEGNATVYVDADTSLAAAAFRKLREDADRAMADINRQKATAEVSAKTTDFDRKIDNVKREIDNLEHRKARTSVELDKAKFDAEIAEAKAELKELSKERATIRVDAKELRDANTQARLLAKGRALEEKAALDAAKAERTAAREVEKATAARQKATDQTYKDAAALDKLRVTYSKLANQERGLNKTGRPGGIFRSGDEARRLEAVRSQMRLTEHEIAKLGGSVDDIDPSIERHQGLLGRWIGNLSDLTVRVGPFTASLKQLATATVVLGPLITGLIGGATSLIGVLGTGIVGAGAVGTAALGGFATSALGVGLVLKPLVGDFTAAKKASEALAKAQVKYGASSDQAKTAQEQLNHTLAGVSPIAKQAFQDYGKLGSQWRQLTGGAKPAVFDAVGQSIKTAQALLPTFARESVATTKTASHAWEGWMKSLRSSEAKQLLGDVMSNFRDSIPGIADGLGSIGATLGRIGASASKLLPGLSHGFADWANHLEQSVGGGDALDDDLQRMVGHMQDLGHLAQSSGSLIAHILNTSADSGDDLVQSLTRVTDRWDKWVQSAGGQESLKNFFGEAADETKQFFGAIGGLTKILFQIGRATAPLSAGFLDFATALGDVVSAITGFAPLRGILTGLGVALGGLWAVGKVRAFAGAIGDAATAIKGMATATAAADVAEWGQGLGKAEKNVGPLSTALRGLMPSLTTLGAFAVPAALVGGLFVLQETIGGVGSAFDEASKKSHHAAVELTRSVETLSEDGEQYTQTQHHQASATDTVTAARKRLLKVQSDSKAPLQEQLKALDDLNRAEREQAKVSFHAAVGRAQAVRDAKATLAAARERVKAANEEIRASKVPQGSHAAGRAGMVPGKVDIEDVAKAEQRRAAAMREVAVAAREAAVANIPFERQAKGLKPISEQTEAALHKLSTTIGAAATKKIGNFVKPSDVAQITNLSNRLTRLGQGTQVKKIDVRSKGADQTLNKLQQLQRQTSRVTGQTARLNVKTNDQGAQQALKRLASTSQRLTGSNPTIRILANSSSAEQAIQRLRSHLTQFASQQYKATLSAVDKSQPGWQAAYHHAREFASQRYEATLEARDQATAGAKRAKQAADAVKGTYQANISAPGAAQAASEINNVVSALSGIVDKSASVHINYSASGSLAPPGGGPKGGATGLVYSAPSFAIGGEPDPRIIDRAFDRAQSLRGGNGRYINKPTFLVGEEGGAHPEYVIASNPAYRRRNEGLLEQAAGALGKEVIAAASGGKSKGSGNKGGNKNSGGNKGGNGPAQDNRTSKEKAGPPPYKKQSKKHWVVHNHKFAPGSVQQLNEAEGTLSNLEGKFNAELQREEQEIDHNKRDAWDFGTLKGLLNQENKVQSSIINALIPTIVTASTKARDQAEHQLKGPLSKGNVKAARSEANKISREYSGLRAPQAPTKKPGETDAEFNKRKKAYNGEKHSYETRKAALKRQAKESKAYADRLEKERADALRMKEDAQNELHEVRHEVLVEHETALKELETEQTNVAEIQENPALAPYYETPESQKQNEGPSDFEILGLHLEEAELAKASPETIAALRQQRLGAAEREREAARATPDQRDDMEAFADYKTAVEALEGAGAEGGKSGAPTAGEETATYNAARQELYRNFASNITGGFSAAAAAVGSSSAAAAALGGAAAGATPSLAAGGAATGSGSGSVQVVNNFAAPPPDPHTWTKQQEFELGALG